jgi:DNA-binding response OmpR family regulator
MNPSKTILVIDDDEKFSFGLVSILRRNGYQVLTANNGALGLEMIRSKRPDIILSDVMMPPPNGIQLKKELAGEPEIISRIPFLFLTARTSTADKVVGLEYGADDYITKPFDINELLARIKSVLARDELGRKRGIKEMAGSLEQLYANISLNLSHEMRTPLTELLTTLDAALRDKFNESGGDLYRYIEKENSSPYRINFLVEDLVMLNNMDQGNMEPSRERIPLEGTLAAIIDQTSKAWAGKDLNFQLEINPGMTVYAPNSGFSHVLSHLLDNACKFSLRESVVKVSVRENGLGGCIFEVLDEGVGIPLEMREKVFERYFQIRQGDANQYGGLGIGLTLARAFAKSLKGDVQILDSRAGCRTRMVIPQYNLI